MSYIIRRLIAAVGLVIVISMITFAIFYLIPRIGGSTPGVHGCALRGPIPDPYQLKAAAEELGFYDPVPVQYWHWLQGVFVGPDVTTAPRRPLPGTLPGLLLQEPTSRSCPRSSGSR